MLCLTLVLGTPHSEDHTSPQTHICNLFPFLVKLQIWEGNHYRWSLVNIIGRQSVYQQPMDHFWSPWKKDDFSVCINNSCLRYADYRLIFKGGGRVFCFIFFKAFFFSSYEWIIKCLTETDPSPKLTLFSEKWDWPWFHTVNRKGAVLLQILTVLKRTSNLYWQ